MKKIFLLLIFYPIINCHSQTSEEFFIAGSKGLTSEEFFIQERFKAKGEKLKYYKRALANYNKAIKINPNYKEAYLYRGIAKTSIDDFQGAISDFNKALIINPDYEEAYLYRAIAKQFFHSNYKAAMPDFNKAIQINPKDAIAYYYRGLCKYRTNDYLEAIADFNQAIEISPDYGDAYYFRGWTKFLCLNNKEDGCLDVKRAIELGSIFNNICN